MALGTTLLSEASASEPPSALPADPPSCAVAVGPATQSVYVRGWTTFWSVTYQDAVAVADHVVTQVVGVYPDGDQARAVFRALADGVDGCLSAVRTDTNQNTTKWFYTVNSTTSDRLVWTAIQDVGNVWACHRQARLKGAAVLQVSVCGAGDGMLAAETIADQFVSKVSG